MEKAKRIIPNIITGIRVLGAIAIIFLTPLSLEFFIVYGVCGISDAFDGPIARKLHSESRFGSILDSISDLLFLGVMAIKMMPTFIEKLAIWNWIIILVPFTLHMLAYVICAIKFHRFSSVHTYANKILSAAIFVYPFTFIGDVRWIYETYAMIFGTVGLYSSVEINLIHLVAHKYDDRNKSIFLVKRNEALNEA